MKYFKGFLVLIILGVFGLVFKGIEDVKAISINFDFGNNSPRFQYLYDDNDELILFDFEVFDNFDSPDDIENINITLDQVTYDGVFIKTLKVFTTDYYIFNSTVLPVTEWYVATEGLIYMENIYIGDLSYIEIQAVQVNAALLDEIQWYIDGDYLVIYGNNTTIGDDIVVHYRKEFSDSYKDELIYDWSGLQRDSNEIFFYRVRLDELILLSGAVMEEPQNDLTYDTYGIEFNQYLIEDNGLVDFTDQSDFTNYLDTDRYMILHYRIPQALINVYGNRSIYITDLITNTIEEIYTTDDILSLQMLSDITQATDFINSFIVIPLDETVSGGLLTSYDIIDDRFDSFLHAYEEGSYYIAIFDGATTYYGASAVWNIMQENKDPFELDLSMSEVTLTDLQRVMFHKNSELLYSGYTTTVAQDMSKGVSYVDNINASNYYFSASYYPYELATVGDIITFKWYVEPSFMPYSLDPSDFTIEMEQTYLIIEERGLDADIDTLRTTLGMGDTIGGAIFSIMVIFFINLMLLRLTKSLFIFSIVDLTLVGLFSYLGFLSMWFIMGIVLLALLGIKLAMGSGGGNYE